MIPPLCPLCLAALTTELQRQSAALPAAVADLDLLNAARDRLGSDTAVADALGVGKSSVSQWRTARKVPEGRRGDLAALGVADAE